jgi:pimeloyl-ACP methyl ester carboxylesterase
VRLLDDWVTWRRECPVSRASALRQLWAAARYKAPAAKPAVPMLVLTSTHDGLVDTRCSERLAAAWQCEIARHPQAGHDLPLDDSAWVLAQIQRWLADQLVTAPDR